MKVTIHQPNYFPYPGLFHKLSLSDVFVILDNVQYEQAFGNRNRIFSENNGIWLTVPLYQKDKFLPNKEIRINNETNWRQLHWKKIIFSYSNSKYFHLYREFFRDLYKKSWKMLFDLNFHTLKKTLNFLGMEIEIVLESELNVQGKSTERLINICKKLGADTYISGIMGKNYLNEKLFAQNNLNLKYQNYSYVEYQQHLSKKFLPNLSIIDLLSNMGPKSLDCITDKISK